MGWIVWTIIATLIVPILLIAGSRIGRAQDKSNYSSGQIPPWIFGISSGVVVLAWFIITLFAVVHNVENGHVGLVKTFGAITGQRGDGTGGLVLTWPFQSITEANVQTQLILPPTSCYGGRFQNCMEAFTSETQDVFINAAANIKVNPQNIQSLYRTVGPDYVNKLVLSRMAQIAKEESVKYSADKIAPSREELRKNITKRLTDELSARSIIVEDFFLPNVDFEDGFKKAIALKVQAEQDAQTEQNKVAIETAKALQAQQQGIAKANALREEANGQADANRAINSSLTPLLVQFQALQKLGPDLKIAIIPAGQGVILDPTNLLGGFTTPAAGPAR